jgi:hypothetical protein
MAIGIAGFIAPAIDTTDRSAGDPYTTSSRTWLVGHLYELAVVIARVDTINPPEPTLTLAGLTITLLQSRTMPAGATRRTLFRYRVIAGSETTGAISIDNNIAGPATSTAAAWACLDVTGQHATTPNVQSPTGTTATSADPAATLAAFADAVNNAGIFWIVSNNTGAAVTFEAGWTEVYDAVLGGSVLIAVAYQIGEDTSPSGTITSALWGTLAGEIAVAASALPITESILIRYV